MNPALLSYYTTDTAQLVGRARQQFGDFVESVSDFSRNAGPTEWQPREEIALTQSHECAKQLFGFELSLGLLTATVAAIAARYATPRGGVYLRLPRRTRRVDGCDLRLGPGVDRGT